MNGKRARRLQIVLWIVIPVLTLVAAEGVFRVKYPFPVHYWKAVDKLADGKANVLFVGNSQVACAIDAKVFAEEAGRRGERPVVVNAGMGWSVAFQHYLGLKKLARERPEVLKNCTVFIDAPGGLPVHGVHGHNLYANERPEYLWGLVGWRELPEVWGAKPSWEQRTRLAASWVIGQSALLTRANQIGSGFVDKFRRKFVSGVRGWRKGSGPAAEATSVDLTRAGGVRIDAQGVALVKDIVAKTAERDLKQQKPLENWDETDVGAIVRLVQDAGGKVVFYRMPLHSAQAKTYRTQQRQSDRERFRQQAATWGVPIVEAAYTEKDEDFPDHLHLGAARAAKFSRELAIAWRK